MDGERSRSLGAGYRTLGFALLGLGWELASRAAATPLMPGLVAVFDGARELLVDESGLEDIRLSVTRVATGLAIATLVGTVIGIAISQFEPLLVVLTPVLDVARSTAGLAIYPLIIVFLGLGESSKVFLVFWGAWPPILLNTVLGIEQVDAAAKEAARIDGAGRLRSLRHIELPLAAPTIVTGVRIGAGIGWIGLVAAEMVVGTGGLGYQILINSQVFQYRKAYAAVFLVSLCGFATHYLLNHCHRILARKVSP